MWPDLVIGAALATFAVCAAVSAIWPTLRWPYVAVVIVSLFLALSAIAGRLNDTWPPSEKSEIAPLTPHTSSGI